MSRPASSMSMAAKSRASTSTPAPDEPPKHIVEVTIELHAELEPLPPEPEDETAPAMPTSKVPTGGKAAAVPKQPLSADDTIIPPNHLWIRYHYDSSHEHVKNDPVQWNDERKIHCIKQFEVDIVDEKMCARGLEPFEVVIMQLSEDYEDCTIDLTSVYFGRTLYEKRMTWPGVQSAVLTIRFSQQLVPHYYLQRLLPLRLRLLGVNNAPSEPMSFESLSAVCLPPFCRYKFFTREDKETIGVPHESRLRWEHEEVFFLSDFPSYSELCDYLKNEKFVVELHDRDPKPPGWKDPELEEDDDNEEENLTAAPSRTGLVKTPASRPDTATSGKRSAPSQAGANASAEASVEKKDGPSPPEAPLKYGVATFSLTELLRPGTRFLKLRAPVQVARKLMSKRTQVPVDDDSETVKAPTILPGQYGAYNTECVLTVEAAAPLPEPEKELLSRIVFNIPYEDTETLHRIHAVVMDVNARALGVENAPNVSRTLTTYQLKDEQKENINLDIITGFQVIDGDRRIFVLEGLVDGGLALMTRALLPQSGAPVLPAGCVALYNKDETFAHRLYLDFDVEIKPFKLRGTFATLMRQPEVSIFSKVPSGCVRALRALSGLLSCRMLREARRMRLFPTATDLTAMDRKYADTITSDDLEGVPLPSDSEISDEELADIIGDNKSVRSAATRRTGKTCKSGKSAGHRLHVRRVAALDMANPDYERHLLSREKRLEAGGYTDFIASNIQQMTFPRREREPVDLPDEVYVYSGQRLNYGEMQKEALRKELVKDKDNYYTYSKEFFSLGFSLVEMSDVERKEKEANQAKWRTERGFVWPAPKDPSEYNVHPHKLSDHRVEDLKVPFVDNVYTRETSMTQPLPPSVKDFNCTSKRPQLFEKDPQFFKSVHLAGVGLALEKEKQAREEEEAWRRKVVVDRDYLKFNLHGLSRKKPHPLDRGQTLRGSDPPMKKSLKDANLQEYPTSIFVNEAVEPEAEAPVKPRAKRKVRIAG
eukprot:Rmarinus@m.24685